MNSPRVWCEATDQYCRKTLRSDSFESSYTIGGGEGSTESIQVGLWSCGVIVMDALGATVESQTNSTLSECGVLVNRRTFADATEAREFEAFMLRGMQMNFDTGDADAAATYSGLSAVSTMDEDRCKVKGGKQKDCQRRPVKMQRNQNKQNNRKDQPRSRDSVGHI